MCCCQMEVTVQMIDRKEEVLLCDLNRPQTNTCLTDYLLYKIKIMICCLL